MRVHVPSFLLLCVTWGVLLADAQVVEAPPAEDFALPAEADLPGAGPLHREDWFQHVWRERRGRWATQTKADQGAVVFLGDSITQGWGDDFSKHFPELHIANRGIGGDTTRGMLFRLEEDVLALNPKAVVMLLGTNDIGNQADPAVPAANFKLILDKLKAHNPNMPVVLCLVFPSSEKMFRPQDKIRKLNELYLEIVKDYPQVTVLDTWTLFANEQGNADPEMFPDLLHLNEAGYRKWAAALQPVLAGLKLQQQ